jgi:hypothetical protein
MRASLQSLLYLAREHHVQGTRLFTPREDRLSGGEVLFGSIRAQVGYR